MTKYRPYNVTTGEHGTHLEEWGPHAAQTDKTMEWWYLTNLFENDKKEKFFQHVILFHFAGAGYLRQVGLERDGGPEHYLIAFAVSDYTRRLRVSEVMFAKVEDDYDPAQNTMKFDANGFFLEWSFRNNEMVVKGRSPRQNFELKAADTRGVLWAKDKLGVHGMIAESSPDEPSFYYSLPTLEVKGSLAYIGDDGKEITAGVAGQGWCDRQWGDYMTQSWEWCSMRFFNGDRVNLYAFPQTGHKVGSYMHDDGKIEYFDNFTVRQKSYFEALNDVWLACSWEYELPVKGKKYRVEAFSKDDLFITATNSLIEGLGYLYDEKGKLVGYTANESMDLRVTNTGPYKNVI